MENENCCWCGRPEDEHGPPGESDWAKHVGDQGLRLCPTPGVTSQFYTRRPSELKHAAFTLAEVQSLRAEVERLNEIVSTAHHWVRHGLGIEDEAKPYRFDFYAQEIERLRALLRKCKPYFSNHMGGLNVEAAKLYFEIDDAIGQ